MARRRATPEIARLSDPVLQFLQTVWQLEHALERASKRMEDAEGISGPQRFALRMIGECPGITAGELATVLRLHPSTVTGIVQRLESRKLVRRSANAADGRVAHLHLTPAGSRANKPAGKGTIERAARTTLARMPETQRKATAAAMGDFASELMKI
ncbi:MAG TPA: MarR family transcriptional regulator [Vicinamibacterales bacterium]|nr:MarR family transcriptional regulator [Vicinamibacterales bacterium]